ncbi:hypothetical protein [Nannocystis punicea]|uniref:Uncharacterized protein n=1 Tax=Nannocystis punicea TaxID=2995304 RepID=A0ABY7HJ11_9BACT|nr:hypothetical protein [Nannocystis poenicansa]WAS99330.1 hypothetical protein O0S08_24645 [Nannocystis poenicansa]
MATDGRLNELVDELRAGGEVDSQGRFTLDRAQARAKMQKFQLADARRYVLELVQAAALRGATRIAFDIDADDMRMRFDGRPFRRAELDELWGSIFADGDEADLRGLRQLALGLNAALGLGPSQIVLRSGPSQLRLVPGREDALTTIEPPIAETTIHVEKRLHVGLLIAFFRDLRGSLAEEVYLRERCAHAQMSITLDGQAIAFGPRVAHAMLTLELAEPGMTGMVALLPGDSPAEVHLVKDGVWIDTHPLEGVGPGMVAIVEAEALRKDVSMAKIVADAGFEQVAVLVRATRWALLARAVAGVESGELRPESVMPRIRAEVLQFLKLRDLRKRAEVAPLARAITWMDARTCSEGHVQTVGLEVLAGAVTTNAESGARELRYATGTYSTLKAEGPPIPRVPRAEANQLARLLACNVIAVDDALAAAQQRERARLAWLQRRTSPQLPKSRKYLLRAPLAATATIRGELGLAAEAVEGGRTEGRIWLIGQGCLLRQIEVDWGVAGLELAVEGPFTPGEMFDDAARDAVLVEVVLRALAALQGPLADLAQRSGGTSTKMGVRGVVKAWLLLALDAETRVGLWQRLGVPEALWPGQEVVGQWLPSAAQLRASSWPLAALMHVPLFEDFDGARRSLDELARRQARVGRLEEIDRSVAQEPSLGREIAWLGRGDRKILAGLLGGESMLQSWAPTLAVRRREREFWAQNARSSEELTRAAHEAATAAGIEPGLWCHSWRTEEVEAVLTLHPPGLASAPAKEVPPATIELRFEGRPLTRRTLELGFGPITGLASATGLRPNASWDDVAEEAAVSAVAIALRSAAWALVMGVVDRWVRGSGIDDATWTWLRSQLLRRLAESTRAEVLAAAPLLMQVPLFATIGRRVLSLEEVEAVVAAEGRIAWVPMTTPGATLPEPPIVREDAPAIAALRRWVGEAGVVDGSERVRAQRLARRLAELPTITSLTLDAASVWTKTSLADEKGKVEGEVGLRRENGEATLRIDVCLDGRKIGEFVHEGAAAPLVAIASDLELPLTSSGEVDTRTKRYGHLLRRCRRAATNLIVALCEGYESLPVNERAAGRVLLLEYAARRIQQATKEGSEPGRGVEAVKALPLLIDVWGSRCSLAEISVRSQKSFEVVTKPVEAPPRSAESERRILVVDPPARRLLEALGEVKVLDYRWEAELAAIRALAAAPECKLPDLREVAWVDRKAMIAGGLEAHLWIPRTPTNDDTVALAREGREVGRIQAAPGLPCAGIVSGWGLNGESGAMRLDARQHSSLGKQVCRLYETLAKQVKSGGRMNASERDKAANWLAHVDESLESAEGMSGDLGKALTELKAALAEIVPPALRKARAKAAEEARRRVEAEAAAQQELVRLVQDAARRAQARELQVQQQEVRRAFLGEGPGKAPGAEAVASAVPAPAPKPTPEQQLLALVRAELEWARARHGSALEQLRLDRLAIGTGSEPGIARFDEGIVLQQRHSLIARALTRLAIDEAPDPIDMMFVMANVYTVMNEVAEEIEAHDEQAFVARLAEGLAAGLG